MALVTFNLRPSQKQLKSFGLICLVMCSVIGGLLFGSGKVPAAGLVFFIIAGIIVFTLGRISTNLIKPVYWILVLATFPIGWVISHVVMALFYYGVITPIGIVFKLTKRDPLCRQFDPDTETYWIPYKHKRTAKDYFRQF